MFATTVDSGTNHRIEIAPNRSMNWRQLKIVFACIAAYSLMIAMTFAAMGYWPVLPWAGGELAALGTAFYVSMKSGEQREVVEVQDDVVSIEKLDAGPSKRWSFQRSWAQVSVRAPHHRGHPTQLVVRSHGREVRLGEFLSEEERTELARELDSIIRTKRV